jgi:hypothetical protein
MAKTLRQGEKVYSRRHERWVCFVRWDYPYFAVVLDVEAGKTVPEFIPRNELV